MPKDRVKKKSRVHGEVQKQGKDSKISYRLKVFSINWLKLNIICSRT